MVLQLLILYTKESAGGGAIDVLQCNDCGLVRLSEVMDEPDEFYRDSGMRDGCADSLGVSYLFAYDGCISPLSQKGGLAGEVYAIGAAVFVGGSSVLAIQRESRRTFKRDLMGNDALNRQYGAMLATGGVADTVIGGLKRNEM